VTLNWTRYSQTHVGGHEEDSATATDDQSSSGEQRYRNATLTTTYGNSSVILLAEPTGQLRAEITTLDTKVEPTDGEEWRSGWYDNESRTVSDAEADPLTETHDLPGGQPVATARANATLTLQGTLTLAVWGPNVTVDHANGTDTYRSGTWTTNETGSAVTGDEAAVREKHAQLLRLKLHNATVEITHEAGLAQWTSPNATVHAHDRATFADARGQLVDPDANTRYPLDGDDLALAGPAKLTLSPSTDGNDRLAANVHEAAEVVDVHPVHDESAQANAIEEPTDLAPWLAGSALVLAAGAVLTWRARRRRPWNGREPVLGERDEPASGGDLSPTDPPAADTAAATTVPQRPTRERLRTQIEQTPGQTAYQLAERVDRHVNTVRSHLRELAEEGEIASERRGHAYRYYPPGLDPTSQRLAAALAHDTRGPLLRALRDADATLGVTQAAARADLANATASRQLAELEQADLVESESAGNAKPCQLSADAVEAWGRLEGVKVEGERMAVNK
jgi:predicted transcriptional regulator